MLHDVDTSIQTRLTDKHWHYLKLTDESQVILVIFSVIRIRLLACTDTSYTGPS